MTHPKITVRYTDGKEIEFTPDSYDRTTTVLIMRREDYPEIGVTETTIVNYSSTQWIRIVDRNGRVSSGFL